MEESCREVIPICIKSILVNAIEGLDGESNSIF